MDTHVLCISHYRFRCMLSVRACVRACVHWLYGLWASGLECATLAHLLSLSHTFSLFLSVSPHTHVICVTWTFSGDPNFLERMAYEFCEDQAQQGCLYTEARFSPHLLASSVHWVRSTIHHLCSLCHVFLMVFSSWSSSTTNHMKHSVHECAVLAVFNCVTAT